MKVRQDAWSHEDDLLLAETVLRHIREGSTQVAAFDEACDQLNRTSAACGYRWNAEVRSQYVKAVEMAKKQWKEKKRAAQGDKKQKLQKIKSTVKQAYESKSESKSSISLDDCIAFLRNYHSENHFDLKEENNRLKKVNQEIQKKNKELSLKYERMIKRKQEVDREFLLLMNILRQSQNLSDDTVEQKHLYH